MLELQRVYVSNDAIADETLMLRFIEGDAQAFEALYARHKGGVYRYFTRHVDKR